LTTNYHVLMSQDLPMRDQRGILRNNGYQFVSDGQPRGFAETVDLTIQNVIAPSPGNKSEQFDTRSLVEGEPGILVGAGPFGLRLIREGDSKLLVYQRVCDHEGSSLDSAQFSADCLICPWHAKRIKPLAVVALDQVSTEPIDTGVGMTLQFQDGICTVDGLR
jgi:hypothetical protein